MVKIGAADRKDFRTALEMHRRCFIVTSHTDEGQEQQRARGLPRRQHEQADHYARNQCDPQPRPAKDERRWCLAFGGSWLHGATIAICAGDARASVDLNDGQANAGNPDLAPAQTWELEVEAVRDLGAYGSTTLRAYRQRIDDIVDTIPIGVDGESYAMRMWDRTVYLDRRTGPVDFIEDRHRRIGPILSLTLSGKF